MARILVAYASRYGSTRGIAEAIGQALSEQGGDVTVAPVRDIRDVSSFDAVVVGAPLYFHGWLPEALEFLTRFRLSLLGRPLAIFGVGLSMLHGGPGEVVDARECVEASLREVHELQPVSLGIFTGVLQPRDHPFFMRWYLRLRRAPEGDFRDWDEIRRWALQLDFHPLHSSPIRDLHSPLNP
ncbi:MAG: flavodoxin domain-containing protein [Deltaproteobacteria bacterium]|nr:flavodoxin domain-containing protein [Deltaproteobacteria bacterium]